MAETINYRKNLITNGKALDGITGWTTTGIVGFYDGTPLDYFSIGAGGTMTQTVKMPKIYPSLFHIRAMLSEPSNTDKGAPNLVVELLLSYRNKDTDKAIRDRFIVPAISPIFQSPSDYDGKIWNSVSTSCDVRDMPTAESGYELLSATIVVRNIGPETVYATKIEVFSADGSAPTYGDGSDTTNPITETEAGIYKLSHPSGSYIEVGKDIIIYAVGDIDIRYKE